MSIVTVTVLVAACLHASWNAIAHAVPDRLAGFAVLGLTASVLSAIALPFVSFPASSSWPLLLTSAGVHSGYNVLLMQSYRLGEFNQVYPLARGTSPWVVAIAATVFVGEHLAAPHALGVAVVSGGLIVLVFAGGIPGRREIPALAAAFATGLFIAGYTVIDGVAVRRSGTATGYTAWLFLLEGLPVAIGAALVRRWALAAQARAVVPAAAVGGVLSMAAYGLVLWAQTHGALATIAALRESSIIVGAIIGTVFFHERFGRIRLVATVVVVCGIVLLNV